MPATVTPGQVLIDIMAGQRTYVNLIYSGPGHFVCPLTDLSIPIQMGTWTSCGGAVTQTGGPAPVAPTLPLNQGRYRLDIRHDMGPCAAPQGAVALDQVIRQQNFGPEMWSFTMGKSGRPDIACDIVVVMQAVGSGGGASSGTGGQVDRRFELPTSLPSAKPSILTNAIRKLIKRRRPIPPIPPDPPFRN